MMSEVYFSNLSGKHKSWLDRTSKLFDRAKFASLIEPGDIVAIKVHFGERGNTAFLSPLFVRRVVDKVKAAGGKPFVTDANTLYVGARSNAVDHLITAIENGFSYATVGAPLIIADGINGKDYITVGIDGKHVKEAKIGSAVYHADAVIALTHFKGHELTGFGGALKNIGMGLGSRSGKQVMHSDVLPSIEEEKCTSCGKCIKWCPAEAITVSSTAAIDASRCLGCGECTVTCSFEAIAVNWKTEPDLIQEKIVEYTWAVIKDKPDKVGYFNFITNVSPDCDCCGWNDTPIVPDIGILASFDPIAIDQACVDLVNRTEGLPGSRLSAINDDDKFRTVTGIDWRPQLAYGEKIGLGKRNYTLVEVK
ncbi:MAG: DUF362 domain-containing protein [Actinobacteria bacterium]|nr:DUF362 domain-containing protein [Actinomycetota bacterium]